MTDPAPDRPAGDDSADARLTVIYEWVQELAAAQEKLTEEILSLSTARRPEGVPTGAVVSTIGSATKDDEEPAPKPAPNWRLLSDDDAQEITAELYEWVEWLTGRFRLQTDLPACWHQHPDLFEELSALWAAHVAAYAKTAAPNDGLSWLTSLNLARDRWRRWNTTKCSFNTHAPAALVRPVLTPVQ